MEFYFRYPFCLFLILMLSISNLTNSQNLINGAESVAFDSLNNRYLVTSLQTRKVISIDKMGNQSIFKENIVAYGNCIKDSVLYVSGNASIRGLSLNSAEDVFSITIPGVQQFDGITVDDSGFLYAMATRIRKVYKINLTTKKYSIFVDGGFGTAPQDLIFDKFKNRILACQWHANSSLLSINLEDSSLTTVVQNTAGFADGITIDQNGNVYVTSYNGDGEIYKYDNDFSNPAELIYVGIEEPAGLDYNIIDDVLAVPSFAGDKVIFIDMPPIYLFPKINVNYLTGHAPLALDFTEISSSNPATNLWEWDFNDDGITDSYEKNPQWTFSEPGVYKVSANIYNDSLSGSVFLEDSIIVFSGESSLNFQNKNSFVTVPPNPELNLNNKWSFEAWIYPTNLLGKYILHKNSIGIFTNKRSGGLGENNLVFKFRMEDESTLHFTSEDNSLTTDRWHHISCSYDYPNNSFLLLIDGKIQNLSLDNSSIFSNPIQKNDLDTMIIGNNNTGLRSFNGRIDEIRVWKKALSKEEIDLNRFEYLIGEEPDLAAYWNLNEGNELLMTDKTNNRNHGKIVDAIYDWGIDYNSLVGINSETEKPYIANEYTLFQNYPNPFNPSTLINFIIPASQLSNGGVHVKLIVYDILGREVKTLLNDIKKPGTYNITFDALSNNQKISSGVYFYKLTANDFVKTRKMMLIY